MWKKIIVDRKYIEYADRQAYDIFESMYNNGRINYKLGFRDNFFISKKEMKYMGVYPIEFKIYKDVMVLILVSSVSKTFNLIYKVNGKN